MKFLEAKRLRGALKDKMLRGGVEDKSLAPETAVRASAQARAMAEESGVDLALIQGTGSDGQITVGDVRRFIGASES